MIVGLGNDLCDIERIREALGRRREAFLNRVLTAAELQALPAAADNAPTVAMMFAIKEAGVKALGAGITRWAGWHDLEVSQIGDRAPSLKLSGGALRRLRRLTPRGWVSHAHITAGRSRTMITALVVLEARPS